MVITKEEIFEGLQSDAELEQLLEHILQENTKENFQHIIEIIREELFKKPGLSKEKYHVMKLFIRLSDKGTFINALQRDKEMIDIFIDLAQSDKELPYDKRGLQIFGKNEDPLYCGYFYDFLMECLSFWGSKFNVASNNNPTKFAKALDKLSELGVQPKLELNFFRIKEEQYEILRKYAQSTEQQQKQKINMSDQGDIQKIYQEMYNETNALAEELEQNLKGEDEATEILDQLLDACAKQAEDLKQKLDLLVAQQNEFREGMRKQINYRSKMINSLIEKHTTLRTDGFLNENYRVFKYEMLLLLREITGSEKPKPPPGYNSKSAEQNQIKQPDPEQIIQKPPPPKPLEKPPQNNQNQPYNPVVKPPQPVNNQQYLQTLPYQQPYQQPQKQLDKPKLLISNRQNEQKQLTPPKNQKIIKPKPQPPPPVFRPPQQQPQQQIKSDYHISPNKGNQDFNDMYENSSQNSHCSNSQFFMKGQLNLVTKAYEGQFIPYDERLFEIFSEIYINSGITRAKKANLRNRSSIFESPEIQIGFDSNLVFHEITNRNFLRIRLCFGNKTNDILQNFQYSFEGDTSMGVWAQEPIHQHSLKAMRDQFGHIYLNPGQQMYIPVCINYNRIPYEVISGSFSYETTESSEKKSSHFILPCLLTKFMNYRDCSIESFKTRWEYKHRSILKSEQVNLNSRIIKTPDDFLKSFGPNNVLNLTDYDMYQNQNEREMIGAEYGLVFTLGSPQIEFLLKIIVFPNHSVLFQIIPYQSYQTQAEALLHTLVFIFCLPD